MRDCGFYFLKDEQEVRRKRKGKGLIMQVPGMHFEVHVKTN